MLLMLLGLAVVFGGIFGWRAYVGQRIAQSMAASRPPPITVSATHAQAQTWHPTYDAVGTLEAVHGVSVASEVPGLVVKIDFSSGDSVKQGQRLVQLNDAPDRARLKGLQAQAEYARAQFQRDQDLLAKRGVSRSQYDQDRSALDNALAAVQTQQALIDQKSITAPFDGRLGLRLVDLGQYIPAGTPVATLQALNPIHVNFTLPQQDLEKLHVGLPVELSTDAYPGKTFHGQVTAISPLVEVTTRNLAIQATLDNPQGLLLPGMFAQVSVVLPEQQNVITLPNAAITYNPYGDTVYVIEKGQGSGDETELTVRSVVVVPGATRGDQVAITQGLEAGDWVVTAGQMKLRNGASVTIDNSITPSDSPSPNPPNT